MEQIAGDPDLWRWHDQDRERRGCQGLAAAADPLWAASGRRRIRSWNRWGVGFRDYGADVAILVDTVSRASPIANECLSSSPDAARPYYRQYRGRRRRLSKIAA
ncbi:hypothetical protein [Methylobacterium currus]|uniref:hypothetical protein n=1 Tax=Methylobacterium currus TaxID=2051553 RepID=UPI000F4D8656|nr:hypothetical protein [Methylobacterium currus]